MKIVIRGGASKMGGGKSGVPGFIPLPTPKNPRFNSKYNLVSRLLYCWIGSLMRYGFCHNLTQSDLFAHPEEGDSEKLHQHFLRYWNRELEKKARGGTPRIGLVILKCFWWRFFWQGLLTLIEVALSVSLSLLLGRLARYFSLSCDLRDATETRNAYLQGAGMVIIGFIISFVHSHGFQMGDTIGMLTRITLTSAIYSKVLRLSQVTVGKLSIGHVINLASNDVQRYDLAFTYAHSVWIAPIHVAVMTYLIYLEIGWPSLILAALVCVMVLFQFFTAKWFSIYRLKYTLLTDKRIRIMNEVIVGIRVIKMYAWEYAFKRVVQELRKHEVKLIAIGGIIRALTTAFNLGGSFTFIFGTTFLIHTGSGGELNFQQVFTTLLLVNLVCLNDVIYVVDAFYYLYEASVANTRIQNVLLLEEQFPVIEGSRENGYHILKGNKTLVKSSRYAKGLIELQLPFPNAAGVKESPNSVTVNTISTSWSEDESKFVLRDVSFNLDSNLPLLCVIGAIGTGKSTLLQCILGELRITNGSIEKKGTVSYASQQPWIFTGTFRDNITFGLPFCQDWYDRVIEACALTEDIKFFLYGDFTVIGERGVTLSGGQKARVNLARAVYRDSDIYLLDDPLSAVDAAVGKHIFEECLRGILKSKLVILVTHQVHFAFEADQLLVLKEGQVEMYETVSDLTAKNIDTQQLLGLIKNKEINDEFAYEDDSEAEDEYKFSSPNGTGVTTLSNLTGEGDNIAEEEIISEERAYGTVSTLTYLNFLKAGANYLILFVILIVFLLAEAGSIVADWWLSDWALCFHVNSTEVSSVDNVTCPAERPSDISDSCTLRTSTRFAVYGALVYSTVIIHFMRGLTFYLVCINASKTLHNRMFSNILRVPVHFFDTNPSGRILNRFSKDIGFLDDLIPITIFVFLAALIRFLGILVVAVSSNPYLLTVIPFVIIFYLLLRWYFIKTARDVKRLEALARSPVYSHFSSTLQGLSIVRTFGQQHMEFQKLHHYNNEHTKGWYFYLVAVRWFGLRLFALSNVMLLATIAFSIPLVAHTNANLNPSLLGLGVTYIATLGDVIHYGMRESAQLESQMVSTERILDYTHLENEASLDTLILQDKPPKAWPTEGEISFHNVAFQYWDSLPLVLKDLTFSVRPSEKVGIVGRTGAGKSSLISALFRMAEPAGSITIDGIDTKSIGLHDLRKKISIIPQDPVLFSGTVRYNVDPFEEYSDAELWEVLEQVQLKSVVEKMDRKLFGEVSEAGGNFSVGQKQLVCLARALLRKNKVMILDEATANVDPKTDRIIQQAIREKFTACTVLTIAHRLNTIMDSDRILMMSNGRIHEFASPYRLLQNPNSLFFKMVEKTGPEASKKLHQIATQARFRANRKISVF